MNKVYSQYKIFGAFGICLLFISIALIEFFKNKNHYDKTDYALLFGLILPFLWLFTRECAFIIIKEDKITFINPLLPFLRQTYEWNELDYFIIVDRQSRYGNFEDVWFIKNGKIKKRFSNRFYSNYVELKQKIKIKNLGKQKMSAFSKILAVLGLKKINL